MAARVPVRVVVSAGVDDSVDAELPDMVELTVKAGLTEMEEDAVDAELLETDDVNVETGLSDKDELTERTGLPDTNELTVDAGLPDTDELNVTTGIEVDELVEDGVADGVEECDTHSSPTWNDAPHTCGSCRVSRYVQSKSNTPPIVVAMSSVTELTCTSPSGEHSYVTRVSRGVLRRQPLVSP